MRTSSLRQKPRRALVHFAAVAYLVSATACTGGSESTAPSERGSVFGIVVARDGVTPIPDVFVTLASRGGSTAPSTRSAFDGSYTLENVPVGQQTIRLSRGAFEAEVEVRVSASTRVTAEPAILRSTGKLGYVAGVFDAIQGIVQGQLGNPMDELVVADLLNVAKLQQYRMIFLNCGLDIDVGTLSQAGAALRTFVQEGGTLYASDFAAEYIKVMVPEFDFAYAGTVQTITATVTDQALSAFIGKSAATIAYDLSGWTSLTTVPASAQALLRGSYQTGTGLQSDRPLAITIPLGRGRIVFTTFHNEAGVTADQIAVLRHFIYLP